MEGAYLAHAVYGFFMNGGRICWVVRVGAASERRLRTAGGPAVGDRLRVEAFRATALKGVDGQVELELTEERRRRASGDDAAYEPAMKLRRATSRSFEGLTLKKGRTYIATKVNAGSKLIKIEEIGASLPEPARARRPAPTSCARRRPEPARGRARPSSRATWRRGAAWAVSRRWTRSRCSACPTS